MWETDNACGVPLDVTLKKYVYREPNGFFIESGGQDGLFQSNTLIAEREFGWTGLLIEPASSVSGRDRLGCVARSKGAGKGITNWPSAWHGNSSKQSAGQTDLNLNASTGLSCNSEGLAALLILEETRWAGHMQETM